MTSDIQETDPELREKIQHALAFVRRTLGFWPLVLVTLAVGGIACAVFLHFRKPTYRSETVILYTQGTPASDAPEQAGTPRNMAGRMKELLMSRPKLERVVSDFGLYPKVRRELGVSEAVEEFKQNIDFRAPGGDTFSIAFIGNSPREARDVTTRLASLVIVQDSDLRKNQARVTFDFLVAEKGKTEVRLRSAERELAGFMAKYPRFALDTTPLTTGAAIRATVPSTTTRATPRGPARISGLAPRTGATGATGATAPGPVPPTTLDVDSDAARANASLAAARAHLAEQLERYTPAHPDVRAAAAAVERAETRLATVPSGSAPAPRAGEATPAGAAPEVGALPAPPIPRAPGASFRAARSAATPGGSTSGRDVVALETEWLKLTRAVTEARQRQDQVEGSLFKADILASSESGGHGLQMTVIDPAFLPARPQPPGRTLIAAIFAAVSLFLGIGLALLRAVVDDRILEARDVRGPVELLVEVPRGTRRAHVAA